MKKEGVVCGMWGSANRCTDWLSKYSCTYYCFEWRRPGYLSIANEPALSDSGNRPYMFQLSYDVPGLCRIALAQVPQMVRKAFAAYGKERDATCVHVLQVRSWSTCQARNSVGDGRDDIMLAKCSIAKGGCRCVAYHVSRPD